MSDTQFCSGSNYDFDLSQLPAKRIEKNRGFGLGACAFALPFLVVLIGASISTYQAGLWGFTIFAVLFLIIPSAIFCWGILNLLTVVETIISQKEITETRRNVFGETAWTEPLDQFTLQVKRTTTGDVGNIHKETFHIRLKHSNDMKSIELFGTESTEELAARYREYVAQLGVKEDEHVRDYNTDQVIGDPANYGLRN